MREYKMSKADLNNLGQLKTKEFITTNMNSFGIEYLQSSGNRRTHVRYVYTQFIPVHAVSSSPRIGMKSASHR